MTIKKQIVPPCVASWINAAKTTGIKKQNDYGYYEELTAKDSVYRVMYYILKEEFAGDEVRNWIRENQDAFAQAWLNGYEIEK